MQLSPKKTCCSLMGNEWLYTLFYVLKKYHTLKQYTEKVHNNHKNVTASSWLLYNLRGFITQIPLIYFPLKMQ